MRGTISIIQLKIQTSRFRGSGSIPSHRHTSGDSLALDLIARFKKMDGEIEDCHAAGDMLMYHGVKLKQAFGGTGYNNEVRYFQDFAARMYFMEEEKGHADSGEAEK